MVIFRIRPRPRFSAGRAPRRICWNSRGWSRSSHAIIDLQRACAMPLKHGGFGTGAKHPKWHSDTVSAVLVPDGLNANEVIKTAYHRYNLSLGSGLSRIRARYSKSDSLDISTN